MNFAYPIKFDVQVRFDRYGGKKLIHKLTSDIPKGDQPLGSICEFSGHPREFSVISNGEFKEKNINELVVKYKNNIIGDYVYKQFGLQLPVIIKFMDCNITLPVALHPTNAQAREMSLEDTGKTEAIYIIDSDKGAVFYSGHLLGMNKQLIDRAADKGKTLDCMKKNYSQKGDLFLIPPQRLHAVGGGNLICEIQRNSYSVLPLDWLDWPVDREKRKRDCEKGMKILKLETGDTDKPVPLCLDDGNNQRSFMCITEFFSIERMNVKETWKQPEDRETFHLLTCLEGNAEILMNDKIETLGALETILIPAYSGGYTVRPFPEALILKTYIPDIMKIMNLLKTGGFSKEEIINLGGYGVNNNLKNIN